MQMNHDPETAPTSQPSNIAIVAAVGRNGGIGVNGFLPWRLPGDLPRFRELTTNHIVVMGRKTWESLGSKPLRDRVNVVLTSGTVEGAMRASSLADALPRLALAYPARRIFVIGGTRAYAEALPLASAMHLTRVDSSVPCDAFFPCYDSDDWQCVSRRNGPPDSCRISNESVLPNMGGVCVLPPNRPTPFFRWEEYERR